MILKPANAGKTGSLTLFSSDGFRIGDRVFFSTDTNKIRRRVREINGRCSVGVETFLRPSKGYRRHVRRLKAAA